MTVEEVLKGMIEANAERDVVVEIDGKPHKITKVRAFELREGMHEPKGPNFFQRLLGAKDPYTGNPLYREDLKKPVVLVAEPVKVGLIILGG